MRDDKLLEKIASENENRKVEDIVYGVYNNANLSIFVRIDDFFVDHSKVTLKEKAYFFHLLAIMLNAGLPLVIALKAMVKRTESRRFSRIINTIAYNTEQGISFADSMLRFGEVFDDFEIGIVRAGEAVGDLDSMLFKLADSLNEKNEVNQKLWSASVYPIVVFSILILVTSFMLFWVFPTLLALFSEVGVGEVQLPWGTRMLMFFQDFTFQYWWAFLLVLAGLYLVFLAYVGTQWGRMVFDLFKLKIPYIGSLTRKVYVLRFVDMFGLLVGAGVPIIQVFEIIKISMKNVAYKVVVDDIIYGLRNGEKISDLMGKYNLLFPVEIVEMVRTGESSASLSKVSRIVTSQYKNEVEYSLRRLMSVFEPLMIVFVGLFVAILALSIMGPILNISTTAL